MKIFIIIFMRLVIFKVLSVHQLGFIYPSQAVLIYIISFHESFFSFHQYLVKLSSLQASARLGHKLR